MTCGIYSITSPSGNCYVGSSVNIELRWKQHIWACKRKTHRSEKFQRAYYKYIGNFTFMVLEICSPEDLTRREQKHMDVLKPKYNTSLDAKNPMRDAAAKAKALAGIRTPEERKARSERATARNQAMLMHTPESMAKSKAGNSTEEAKRRNSVRSKSSNAIAYAHTVEAKAKATAYRRSDAGRLALSAAHDNVKQAVLAVATGVVYDSLMDAERKTGAYHSNIAKSIRNDWVCKGTKWQYIVKCAL